MEKIKQYFYDLDVSTLRIAILCAIGAAVFFFLVACFNSGKARKQKKAMVMLVSLLDDDTQQGLAEYMKKAINMEALLKNGPIAEYNRKAQQINNAYLPEIKRIEEYYNAEIPRVQSEYNRLKNEANKAGSAHLMGQYSQKSSSETQALTRKKNAEVSPLRSQLSNELKTLKEEYADDFTALKQVKKYKKDTKLLCAFYEKAKKQNISLPNL